jgi:hypothetical protein
MSVRYVAYLLSSTMRSYSGWVGRASWRYTFAKRPISAVETWSGCFSTNQVTFFGTRRRGKGTVKSVIAAIWREQVSYIELTGIRCSSNR